jgi:hypothetical protein
VQSVVPVGRLALELAAGMGSGVPPFVRGEALAHLAPQSFGFAFGEARLGGEWRAGLGLRHIF